MLRRMAASLAALALAACGGGAPQTRNVTNVTAAVPNPFQDKLVALNETDRMLTLRRGIQDDGESCPRITGSHFQQYFKGMAMWIATCSNRSWAVFVDSQGNVQARPCGEAPEVGMPECIATRATDRNAPLSSGQAKPIPPAGTK